MEILFKNKRESPEIFYFSDPDTGIMGGQGIMSQINDQLNCCDYFVPIITENYVRSLYCMYELNVSSFLKGQKDLKIVPIVSNGVIYGRVSAILQQYDNLICICSPNQLMRKTLFYIEFGVMPQCYSVPTQNMFHDPIYELFTSVNNVLYQDHSWQGKDSEMFKASRDERMIK